MNAWLKGLVGYALLVSMTMQMLPNKKYEQYVRLFVGLLLLVFLLGPVIKIGSAETFMEKRLTELVKEQERCFLDIEKRRAAFEKETKQKPTDENLEIEISPIDVVEVNIGN